MKKYNKARSNSRRFPKKIFNKIEHKKYFGTCNL